jgi:rhamnosyltransferase
LLSSGTLESPYARPLPLRFEVDRRSQAEIAVVVHAFYADLLEDLKAALLHIHEPFDIYVTTPHRADVSSIKNALRDLTPHVVIVTTENRGRDIGPFIALFRAHTFTPYRAVLKVHLKKSLYSAKGDLWRSSLFNQLCSDVIRVDKILAHLGSSRVGIIGPHAFFLANPRYWGANRPMVVSLRRAIGMHIPERESLGFFAGSMFWFTPAALRDIHKLPEALLAFEPEEGLQDGTLAHAYERTFTDMAYNAGFIASSPELNGADITEFSEVLSNSVPVL